VSNARADAGHASYDNDWSACLLVVGAYSENATSAKEVVERSTRLIELSPTLADFIELRFVDLGPRPQRLGEGLIAVARVSYELARPTEGAGRNYFALVVIDRSAAKARQVLLNCAPSPVIKNLPIRFSALANVDDLEPDEDESQERRGPAIDIVLPQAGAWGIDDLVTELQGYADKLLREFATGQQPGLTTWDLAGVRTQGERALRDLLARRDAFMAGRAKDGAAISAGPTGPDRPGRQDRAETGQRREPVPAERPELDQPQRLDPVAPDRATRSEGTLPARRQAGLVRPPTAEPPRIYQDIDAAVAETAVPEAPTLEGVPHPSADQELLDHAPADQPARVQEPTDASSAETPARPARRRTGRVRAWGAAGWHWIVVPTIWIFAALRWSGRTAMRPTRRIVAGLRHRPAALEVPPGRSNGPDAIPADPAEVTARTSRPGLLYLLLTGVGTGDESSWRHGRSVLIRVDHVVAESSPLSYSVRTIYDHEHIAQSPLRPAGQTTTRDFRRTPIRFDFGRAFSELRTVLNHDLTKLEVPGSPAVPASVVFFAMSTPFADPVTIKAYQDLARHAAVTWVVPERAKSLLSQHFAVSDTEVISNYPDVADNIVHKLLSR
jgi:hypothetical protein